MTALLIALNLLLVICMTWLTIRERRVASVYWISTVFLGVLPFVVFGEIKFVEFPSTEFPDESLQRALGFMLIFNSINASAYVALYRLSHCVEENPFRESRDSLTKATGVDAPRITRLFTIAFLFVTFVLLATTIKSFDALLDFKWYNIAEESEGQSQYVYVFFCSLYYALSAAVPFAAYSRSIGLGIVGTLAALGVSLLLGGRAFIVGPLFAGFLVLLFTQRGDRRQYIHNLKRSVLPRIPSVLSFLAATYLVFAFTAWFRSYGSVAVILDSPWNSVSEFWEQFEVQVDPSFGAMLFVFDNFPEQIEFSDGLTYKELVYIPIPAKLISALPLGLEKTSRSVANVLANRIYGLDGLGRFGSVHSTIWGDAYANFGWYGCIAGALWGALLAAFDRMLVSRLVLCLLCLPSLAGSTFLFVRGTMLHAALYLLLPIVICLVLERIVKNNARRSMSARSPIRQRS